jgi:hypothetical protein
MTGRKDKGTRGARNERLVEALRANLGRRKSQMRGRAASEEKREAGGQKRNSEASGDRGR